MKGVITLSYRLATYLRAVKGHYALINRTRDPYKEIFVLTFKAYAPKAVRSIRLEHQNKYFPYGPRSRLIRTILYTYPNKPVNDETSLCHSVVYYVGTFPSPYAGLYAHVQTACQPINFNQHTVKYIINVSALR